MEQLLKRIEALGISLVPRGEQLDIYDPGNALNEELLSALKDNKHALLQILKNVSGNEYIPIPMATNKKYYQLSASQRRLYFQYQFNKTSLAYNIPQAVVLIGVPDKKRLSEAFTQLVNRHEIFRTSFEWLYDVPMQCVVPPAAIELELFDAAGANVPGIIQRFIRPFDLDKPPLFRAGLIKTGENEHVLVVDMHHIVSDGVSAGILIKDFMAIYNDEALAPLQLQYKDFAEWQQNAAQQQAMAGHKKFWQDQFMDIPAGLELPTDFPRPSIKQYEGSSVNLQIGAHQTARLRMIAEKEGATLYMVVLSLFNVLLSKLCNQQDIVIGTITAGRQHPDLANMIGMFANTIVLRNNVQPAYCFTELLQAIRSNALRCFDHQQYPYEELVEHLKIERDTSRNPLFEVLFSYYNFEYTRLEMAGLTLQPYDVEPGVAKFDLTLTAVEQTDTLQLNLEYASSIFKKETIHRFLAYLKQVITTVISDPGVSISNIDIMPETESRLVLQDFNKTAVDYPRHRTVVELFEQQVLLTPDNTAVIYEDTRLSYSALNAAVNQLAHYLQKKLAVQPNDLVGIMLPRTDKLIISILAVLKSGAAYVPIDPTYPKERIELLIENSGLKGIIINDQLDKQRVNVPVLSIVTETPFIEPQPASNLQKRTGPDDNIYVIYTSGSTGVPKGAMVKHHSFTNLINWYGDMLPLRASDTVLLLAPVSFDLAQKNIFVPLIKGAALCLSEKLHLEYAAIANTIEKNRVTMVNLAPSAFYPLLQQEKPGGYKKLQSLKQVVLGGESIQTKELLDWRTSTHFNACIINSYGPTECTDLAAHHKLTEKDFAEGATIPIGKPVYNTQLYVLDAHLKPLPVGVIGEICIAGVCVGKGYLNNAALTKQKFVENPFSGNSLMYRTGDLGKWLPDGDIEFAGRKDDQVKIRGFRVELSEISVCLSSHHLVKEAVVTMFKRQGSEHLTAYYTSEHPIQAAELKQYLLAKLPEHMIPGYYMNLKSMPLNPNGKLDRKALPEPVIDSSNDYVKPGTHIEKELVRIWSEVLDLDNEKISIHSNFFDLGGHSLKIIQLNRLVNAAMNCDLSVANTFRLSNISAMANYLTNGDKKVADIEKELEDREESLSLLTR